MKKFTTILLAAMLCFIAATAQDITGQWNGALNIQGTQLRLVLHISKSEAGFSSTMDSPDQGANGIPVTSTAFENATLKFEIANLQAKYEGLLSADGIITGTFTQGGQSFPLVLSRQVAEKKIIVRSQEPVKPYPYYSEDVSFENKEANIRLAGTLTLPQQLGKFPAVILISGSGPQNRDEELLGHKPFLVLSDYLTRNGIAVLRYDDRGTAASTGNFKTATSADFATDAEAAIAYLMSRKEIDVKKIGLAGHSEGGLIAPMIAARNKDVAYIILLAGPGIKGDALLLLQEKLIAKASGATEEDIKKTELTNSKAFEMVNSATSTEKLQTDLTNYLKQTIRENLNAEIPAGMSEDDFIKAQVKQICSPWMQYFIKYDPTPALEKTKCPVLALNGEKDLQVPPKENLAAIQKALKKAGNKKATVQELPGLNHLFQQCKTGAPDEYAGIDETFSPRAMPEIVKWIQVQVK